MRTTKRQVQVEHITIESDAPYAAVKNRLEREVKQLDESYRVLLREHKIDELRARLVEGASPHGLMIHYRAVHGDWLALVGSQRNGVVYHIGNVMSATQMTQHAFGAGLYAPLRLAVYETASGGTAFEYDRPTTLLSQFQDAQIDAVAKSLDERLLALITAITSEIGSVAKI
ncbi:DUF302 domain-containing protein [Granulicella sp. L60]|uniref:DUF302 domain-containing protein n=1 Tax=Granulicella sp. L60 TaxID=1641866 RepID=UPI001C207DB9|nr:DUF302 domain-containing protein [Granulicella sp. L60]